KRTAEGTIQEESTTRSNPAFPTERRETPLQASRFVEYLYDRVLATVIQSSLDQARLIEWCMVTSGRRLFEKAVDKKHSTFRLYRCRTLCPEPLEFTQRDI